MEFRILGPLEVFTDGMACTIAGAKERAILAYLLLHAGQAVSADRLIDELWGDEPPEAARNSLQVRVAGLRRVIGRDRIVTGSGGYLIRVEPDELDLRRFEELTTRGSRGDLDEALALWRGPPLPEFRDEFWAAPAIARLEELRLVALENRFESDLELGQHAQLVGGLEELVAEHPLRERLRAQLMLALYRSGRQAEALEVYREGRGALIDQLGIEPGPALQELERSMLRQDSALLPSQTAPPERSVLVVAVDPANVDALLAVGEPLTVQPPRELIFIQLAERSELASVTETLNIRRAELLERGIAARLASFASSSPAHDILRLAIQQNVDLLVVDAPPQLLDDAVLRALLDRAPCDVAVLVPPGSESPPSGGVLVPFAGGEHDWSAVELGAWIAGATGVQLQVAGPAHEDRDASRLLASASLVVQRMLGVSAVPLLVEDGSESLTRAADDSGVVVVGLNDRWREAGLGPVRSSLISEAQSSVLLVRSGLRPGGLAPRATMTRFTWSVVSS
jgi:DNA-binding SARP family transcriptional activator